MRFTKAFCSAVVVVAAPIDLAAAQSSAPPVPARPAPGGEEDEIVVSGQRQRGSIPSEAKPETTLNAGEVRALGASSLAEALAAIAPQTGSARGRGGRPVILLNGRRISSFDEIRNIPAEAVARVEIFTEEQALEFGFSADSRVVNFVLRGRYRATTAEGNLGRTGSEAGKALDAGVGHLRLNQKGRLDLNAKFEAKDRVTEFDRGIAADPARADDRRVRTLASDTETYDVNGVWSRVLDKTFAVTASGGVNATDTDGILGRDAAGALIRSAGFSETKRVGATLDAQSKNWQVTTTLNFADVLGLADVRRADVALSSATRSLDRTLDAVVNASGAVVELPAGAARVNLRSSSSADWLSTTSERPGLSQQASLGRTVGGARATLTLPVLNARRGVGGVGYAGLNVSGSLTDYSDFGTVWSVGGGANWAPVDGLRVSAQYDRSGNAPSLLQLGAPTLATPGVVVFDPATGRSVTATTITGGDRALREETRRDLTLNASWGPALVEGLTLSGSFVRNRTDNQIAAFPALTAATLAAYPSRFTRDGSGALVTVDLRPVNFASRSASTVRVGFSFSRAVGPRLQSPWGGGPPPWLPQSLRPPGAPPTGSSGQAPETPQAPNAPASEKKDDGKKEKPWLPPPGFYPPSAAEQREIAARGPGAVGLGPPPGVGRGGFGGANAPRAGRFSASLFYTRRLTDEVVLFPGQPALDLVSSAALGASNGVGGGPGKLEFEGGFSWRGAGLRVSGDWASPYEAPGTSAASDLFYSGVATINLRAFVGFDSRPALVREHPVLRGVRLVARADNLFAAAPTVRDGTGAEPYALQPGFLAPSGRTWTLGVRKQW